MSAAFRESQATIDAAQKRRMQSETLEALFEIFFRVLKQCTVSGYAASDRKGNLPAQQGCRQHYVSSQAPETAGFTAQCL